MGKGLEYVGWSGGVRAFFSESLITLPRIPLLATMSNTCKPFESIVGKEETSLNLFPQQALVFTCLKYKSFENTLGKGEIARKRAISPFPTEFSIHLKRTFCNVHQS